MVWVIVDSGGAVAWGKHYDPPQGAYAIWKDVPLEDLRNDDNVTPDDNNLTE